MSENDIRSKKGKQLYNSLINLVLASKNHKPQNWAQIKKKGKGIPRADLELIFQLYNNAIKAKNESLGFEEDETVRQNEETLKADPPKTRKKRSRSVEYKTRNTIDDEDFKTKLDRFIINSAIDKRVLSKSDLMRITRGWKNGRDEKTDDEWYDYYYKELYSQPGWSKPLKTTYENIKYTVYKTPNKRKKLAFDMVQKTTDKKTNL